MLLSFRGFFQKTLRNALFKKSERGILGFFRRIGADYANTFRDTLQQIRDKPLACVSLVASTCLASAVFISCPNEFDYRGALLNASIDLWDTPGCLQNRRSLEHVEEQVNALFHGQLRHCSLLGLVHIVWRDDRSSGCRLYSEICPYNYASSGPADGSKSGPFLSFLRLFLYDTPPGKKVDEVKFVERARHVISTRIVEIIASLRQLCDKLEQDQSNEKTESVSQTVSGSVYTPNAPLPQRETINNDGSQESFETTNEINKSKDEEEDEWEVVNETLLYADCVGAVESELIEPGKSVLLVDLDTENPLIQIGPAIFQGTYAECLGTNLIFEKHHVTPETSYASTSFTPRPSIEIFSSRTKPSTRPYFTYLGKTSKNLNLQRVFLKPKE